MTKAEDILAEVTEIAARRQWSMSDSRDINWFALDAWQRRHHWVRETTIFGKRYDWYTEIETGKAVLIGPLK